MKCNGILKLCLVTRRNRTYPWHGALQGNCQACPVGEAWLKVRSCLAQRRVTGRTVPRRRFAHIRSPQELTQPPHDSRRRMQAFLVQLMARMFASCGQKDQNRAPVPNEPSTHTFQNTVGCLPLLLLRLNHHGCFCVPRKRCCVCWP